MRRNRYVITWTTGDSDAVYADSTFDAAVIATAKRINEGKQTAIVSIIDEYNEESYVRLILQIK